MSTVQKKIYYKVGRVPKGYKRATQSQAASKGQVRYWGTHLINDKFLEKNPKLKYHLSNYQKFVKENYAKIKKNNPELKNGEIFKNVAQLWRNKNGTITIPVSHPDHDHLKQIVRVGDFVDRFKMDDIYDDIIENNNEYLQIGYDDNQYYSISEDEIEDININEILEEEDRVEEVYDTVEELLISKLGANVYDFNKKIIEDLIKYPTSKKLQKRLYDQLSTVYENPIDIIQELYELYLGLEKLKI